MPTAQITVPYVEMTEGLREGSDDNGGWASKPYGVAWADRMQFVRDVMGYSNMSGGLKGTWQRKYPLQYPDDPNLFARSVDVAPQGSWATTTPLSFRNAIVTVTFRAPDWNYTTQDDPLYLNSFSQDATENAGLLNATQELDYGVEWVELPLTSATFQSSGAKVTTPQKLRVMVAMMKITWTGLPYMPLSNIMTYADVLNDSTFLGRPKGTVYLEGCHTTRTRQADGTITQDLTIALKTRSQDWNKALLPDGSGWDYVMFGTNMTFPYVNMKPLLFVGS